MRRALLLMLGLGLAGCQFFLNTPPRITAFTATPNNLWVTFTWSVSDPDGDALECRLDADGNGSTDLLIPNCTSGSYTYGYPQEGSFTATLVVQDPDGGTATETTTVTPTWPTTFPTPADRCPAPVGATALPAALPVPKTGVADFTPAHVPGELLAFTGDGLTLQSTALLEAERTLGLTRVATLENGWVHYRVAPGEEAAAAAALVARGAARYVQPNYRYGLLFVPNDPYYVPDQQDQFQLLGLEAAWDQVSASCRPVVAVVDTGAAFTHPDLDANLLPGYDFSDDDPDASDMDGHGSQVASLIAAETHNNEGMASVTQGAAYLLPLKVFPNATTLTLAQAINFAVDAEAHVINLSLCLIANKDENQDGRNDCAQITDPATQTDGLIEDALYRAYTQGVLTLAASGNDGLGYVGYPASSSYTLAIGAIDNNKNRAYFSNYGDKLDLVAPGVNVLGAHPLSEYVRDSGTSFAAPFASGVAALYIAEHYAIKGAVPPTDRIRTCLTSTAEDLGAPGFDSSFGFGLVRADWVLDPNRSACYP
ncbi:S8 family serine peptidase [Marinithermus hydrothermalis]|uniref:Peptidase S8 and S53 subtilisin kexin sedolisin n=1 Tax=Marinithermus hydrothermalis (strain DSM 14884 / JCM 11576 / T1) TaxID=869210 RepID=F2NPN3_MARHT|nr:S8 family serine peptidase [Marinithermus hydrothermalis]AEB12534.1 peptidase S8 and S53 subtilisin kexin sedolisin [Marinithermus hydrothermalis DSM 14884]